MLSCKEVTRLLSEAQDRKLSLAEKMHLEMHLEMHLAMCHGCRNFKSQMGFLREACKQYMEKQLTLPRQGSGDELEDKTKKRP